MDSKYIRTVTLMLSNKPQGYINVCRGYISRTGPLMWIEVAPKQDCRYFDLSGHGAGDWRIKF